MGKIDFLSKNYISKFFGDATDSTVNFLDKSKILGETGIPFGKLIAYLTKKAITITDKDKALNQAIGICYYDVVCQALLRYKLNPQVNDDRMAVLGKDLAKRFKVEDFSLERFWDNEIIKFYEDFYHKEFEEVLPIQDQTKLKRYVRDNLKLYVLEHIEEQKTVYENLLGFLKFNKYEENEKRTAQLAYQEALRKFYGEVVLNDTKGLLLKDIYIEPLFDLPEKHAYKGLRTRIGRTDFTKFLNLPAGYNLHSFVYDFLQGQDTLQLCEHNKHFRNKMPRVLLLLGYPGQGKTSFCKRFLYDSVPAEDSMEQQDKMLDKEVYFIRLRYLDRIHELLKGNILEVLREEAGRQAKSIIKGAHRLDIEANDFENGVWLLDGLDELYMSNDLNKNQIDDLLKRLIRLTEDNKKLHIIVTSRYGYVDLDRLVQDKIFITALAEMSLEQQQTWLKKYKHEYETFNPYEKKFKRDTWLTDKHLAQFAQGKHYLGELLRQPLLLHFIALLQHAVEEYATQAKVYKQLFDELIERRYSETGKLQIFDDIKNEGLRELVRGLAFAMFQTGKHYIRKSNIKTLECVKEFQRKLGYKERENSLETMLKNLMIAFYFQETRKQAGDTDSEDRGEYAIEFLHKSLMEYMTAEYMWETIKEKFLDKNLKEKYILAEGNESEALKVMSDLFAKERIDNGNSEIVRYFIQIIKAEEAGKKKEVSERLQVFLPYFFEHHFLYEYNLKEHTNPIETCKRIFFGCWTAFAYSTEGKKVLPEETKDYLAYFVRLRGYRLNLSSIDLIGSDLLGANLDNSNLSYANLNNIYLIGSILINTILSNANLNNALLQGAYLGDANLNGANLSGADLVGANLSDANLTSANLDKTNLSGAYLRDANLSGVTFSKETTLERADLRGAKMDADFKEFARRKGAIVDDDDTEEVGKDGEG
jgi:GTPase SAR1 family protein